MKKWNLAKSWCSFALIGAVLTACSPSNSDDASKTNSDPKQSLESDHVSFVYDAGLKVGQTVPFHVKVDSSTGKTTLEQVLKDGPAVLLFIRSVEWCADCQAELKRVNGIVGDLAKKGFNLFAISYDKRGQLEKFSKNQNIKFELLSDPTSALIDAFDLRDPQFTEGRAAGVPIATVMVLNDQGVIKAKTVSGDHDVRPTIEQIWDMINSVD